MCLSPLPSYRSSALRSVMKFVRCGAFAAEVNVEILEEERSWAPYLSVEDGGMRYAQATLIAHLGSLGVPVDSSRRFRRDDRRDR